MPGVLAAGTMSISAPPSSVKSVIQFSVGESVSCELPVHIAPPSASGSSAKVTLDVPHDEGNPEPVPDGKPESGDDGVPESAVVDTSRVDSHPVLAMAAAARKKVEARTESIVVTYREGATPTPLPRH